MSDLHPMYSYGTDAIILCPQCQTHGGYVRRIQRPWWRRLLSLRKKRYLCLECGHRFYSNEKEDGYE